VATQVNIHEAKTHLSRLVEKALNGEEVVIAKAGKPAVRLVKIEEERPRRQLGLLKGQIWLADDWDSDEVNEEITRLFEGEDN